MTVMENMRDMIWQWLSMIWNSIFKVPLFDSVTGASLLAGVLVICVTIWIIHYFRDNTNAHMGGKHD